MNLNDQHADLVAKLFKRGREMQEEVTALDMEVMHAAIGIAGEAGEIIDAIKKVVIYRKCLDRENVIEELGDMEFYMEALRRRLMITREECLLANLKKLNQRYHSGSYSDQHAQERADKK
jgi:hypothetical protein